jgi:hypothetical protein
MKVARIFFLVGAAALILGSCGSLPTPGGVVGDAIATSLSNKASAAAAQAVAEFQAGEVLASQDSGKIEDAGFSVAKVLQPASAATKNQAEVIFIADGKKYWVNHVVESRKAEKGDLKVGAAVLVLQGWYNHDEIPADAYRKDRWIIGNITSVDELLKNRVEVDGEPYHTAFIRVPAGLK